MTSERLYYTYPYTRQFKAVIVERVHADGRTALILDNTYFYPTSGGQPCDRGKINDVPVVEVTIREEDDAILHWIGAGEIWADTVTGEIEWARRFDHMQQHTGQHILSQAFIKVAHAETVSFHLSDNSVTIDLHTNDLQPEQIEQAELLANQIIWQNRPIHIHMVTPEQAKKLPLRKIPPIQNGKLRLIDIEKFDLTACGGTHVMATGEVGMIKIVKLERQADQLRVEFRCGQRALYDYRLKNSIVNRLMSELTTGAPEIVNIVNQMKEESKENRRAIKRQRATLTKLEAEKLLANGTRKGKTTIVTQVYSDAVSDPGQLRAIANQLTEHEQVVALLGLAGAKSQLLFCRSEDAPGEMNQLLKPALQVLGSAAGGGTAVLAQGGGPGTDEERVYQAVARAERLLIGQIR